MEYKFNKGDLVQINSTGEVTSVLDVYDRCNRVSYIVLSNNKKCRFKEDDLSPYIDEEEQLCDDLHDGNFLGIDAFREFVYYLKFSNSREDNLYSYLGNKIIFNPFQYKPLLKFISFDSDDRLLIADEVGVGKTIESGIILDELRARGELNERTPILIVCPNILCYKWREELATKFSMHGFHIHDGASLKYMFERIMLGYKNPYMFSICSEQLIRGERYYNLLKECGEKIEKEIFEFLIIDECHHYRNPSTNTYKLGKLLSDSAKRVLMLSATPFNLRNSDLYNQLHLLNPILFSDEAMFEQLVRQIRAINGIIKLVKKEGTDHFNKLKIMLNDLKKYINLNFSSGIEIDKIISRLNDIEPLSIGKVNEIELYLHSLNPIASSFTRTMKREAIEHRVTRDTKSFIVSLTDSEYEIYEKFIEVNLNRYKVFGVSERAFGLITNGLERIAASSIPALKYNLERIIELDNDMMESELIAEQDINSVVAKILVEDIKEGYNDIWGKITALNKKDSKYDTLRKLINDIWAINKDNRRIIIFSFYVGTLKYLQKRLVNDGYKVNLIYGGTPKEINFSSDSENNLSRNQIINKFKKGEFNILLASEVGGEGLDFQFCSALINYDLPYNPMRIEQRIGRIDRMGQEADKIIIGSLCIEHTVDEVIKEALLDRISGAEDLIGEMEPIITSQLEEINKIIISKQFTPAELHRRTREMAERIEKEKKVRQDFDEQRHELVNDANFKEEFTNKIINSTINPQEALIFTKSFFKNELGSNIKILNKTSAKVKITSKINKKIKSYISDNNFESVEGELQQIIASGENCLFEFDGNISYYNNEAVFIKPCGEWINFILSCIKKRLDGSVSPLFHIKYNANKDTCLEKGQYWIYIYEVVTNGYRKSKYIHYVPIKSDTKKTVIIEDKKWNDILINGNDAEKTGMLIESEVLETKDIADIEVENYEEQLRKEFISKNEAKFLSRIQALRHILTDKVAELEKNSYYVSEKNKKIVDNRIKCLQKNIGQKIETLEEKRKFSISDSFISLCVLDIN